jgi:rhamnogalacturonan endolyase
VDAVQKSQKEFGNWPYLWLKDKAYQCRGDVSGELVLSDGRPAAGAIIFLGDTQSNKSTLGQGRNYYYTATADRDGRFRIPYVRTGVYALHARPNGGIIADVTTQFVESVVTVQHYTATKLGTLKWKASDKSKKLFQIGAFDRKALGFRNGGAPYRHGLVEQSPANLTYTIGISAESDWYFAQSALGGWRVRWLLEEGDIPPNDNGALLSISLAGYSKGTNLKISVNSMTVHALEGSDIASDPALYRSGTIAGEWHLLEVEIEHGLLKQGWNEIVFEVIATKLWKGFMWDSIWLNWRR